MKTVLSNNIKSINKNLTLHTESGFIHPKKAKSILLESVSKIDVPVNSEKIVDELIKQNTNSMGVDTFNLIEKIADFKTREKIERQKIKEVVRDKLKNDVDVYAGS